MRSMERSPVSASLFLYSRKYRKPWRSQVQYICLCYNIKTAIQTVWNSGGTSDSVVIDWWTSLCDAKAGACVQWLDCSHEVSGFSGLCRSPESASDKKSPTQSKDSAGPQRHKNEQLFQKCS